MKRKPERKRPDTLKNNPDNWKGIFYVNKKDPRIIVPKFYASMGWTLNFGNIYSYLGLIAIIAIILGFLFLA